MSALPRSRPLGRRAWRLAGSVAAGAVVLTTALASATLASAQSGGSAAPASARPGTHERAAGRTAEALGHFDARYRRSGAARAMEYRAASKAANRAATKAFAKALPAKAVFDIDGTTGTVRMLAKLDGYLTGKSEKKATTVALKYVRGNHTALGLTTGDLKTFKLKREYVDIEGVHHLYWIQRINGQTVFGNGLTAAVTKDGRLLTWAARRSPGPSWPRLRSSRSTRRAPPSPTPARDSAPRRAPEPAPTTARSRCCS